YCAQFGGTERRNDDVAVTRYDAPAPSACDTRCGTALTRFGTGYGSLPGELDGPGGIVVDAAGNLYVAESTNGRVSKFDREGNFLTTWGSPGSGPGQLSLAYSGLALGPDGNIYVADDRNERIQKFAPDGTFLQIFGEDVLEYPESVAVAANGDLY